MKQTLEGKMERHSVKLKATDQHDEFHKSGVSEHVEIRTPAVSFPSSFTEGSVHTSFIT